MAEFKDFYFLGHFGFISNKLSGQVTKTREIHKLFVQKLKSNVRFLDTDQLKKPDISIPNFFIHLIQIKILIYLPGRNNLKFLFPFLYILSKLFSFKIHYFVIGGWLPGFIATHHFHRNKLKKIECIYVETEEMLKKLTVDHNFKNVIWYPNFRIDFKAKRNTDRSETLRMVFMSRICLDKGIDTIFFFLDSILNSTLYDRISIDFYGPLDLPIENWFYSQISKHKNSGYLGVVPPEQVQHILCNYDLMLFPTRYPGEGCPGAIIESYMASVPVIASKWKYNAEFVIEGVTGHLFNPHDINRMTEIVNSLVNNRSLVLELGKNAKSFSEKFTQEKAWEIICQSMKIK